MVLHKTILAALVALAPSIAFGEPTTPNIRPHRVTFLSLDGHTQLVGYLFSPTGQDGIKRPAIVLMHGRAGAYSSKADGVYDETTLSMRHRMWGSLWANEGVIALLVDGFGPRGYPHGFPAHSYDERPTELSETDVRPLDAYGALRYLRTRPEVDPHRIALQGWSNGASATIATMSDATLAALHLTPPEGFAGAVAFYPACGLQGRFQTDYRPYAPLRIFSGAADEEVSAQHCARLVTRARAGSDVRIEVYPDATHDFDDPGRKRQSVAANVAAAQAAIDATRAFIHGLFR
jgi:carboxymethylenebutenolidase